MVDAEELAHRPGNGAVLELRGGVRLALRLVDDWAGGRGGGEAEERGGGSQERHEACRSMEVYS